ncbi:MAG: RNA-binding protein [Blastochloris sp.]|nr:RNA-binding protein [Blastochloris sp.]
MLSTKLYIGNLSYETSESDLFDLFSKVGSVVNSEVVRDGQSRSKGFGFVEMAELDKAKEAAEKYHRTDFMGRQIVVAGARSNS